MIDWINAPPRCAATTVHGVRCRRRAHMVMGCTFAWEPTKGVGLDGPSIGICAQHHRCYERAKTVSKTARIHVTRGWLGGANEYGYGAAVWARPVGWRHAAWWWARREPTVFGDCKHREPV